MLRSRIAGSKFVCRQVGQVGQIRQYQVAKLTNLCQIESEKLGIPGLFSVSGLQNAWEKRAKHLIDSLNVYSSKVEQVPISKLIKQYSNNSPGLDIYNTASIYQNLEFSMSCINPTETLIDELSNPLLLKLINKSFNSLQEFKTLLTNSSYNIQGDGFTWLMLRRTSEKIDLQESFVGDFVGDKNEIMELCIVNTYNAGSPGDYLEKSFALGKKLQKIESSLPPSTPDSSSSSSNNGLFLSIQEAQYKYYTSDLKKTQFIPLFGIDSSPKTWLTDYGVFGKKNYLEKLWNHINWNLIEERLPADLKNV